MLTGVGVGFALPTVLSAATADLPAGRSATGSAVINMSRQVGTVLGVSVLVALLGSPVGYAAVHHAFQRVCLAVALTTVATALAAVGITPRAARTPALLPPREWEAEAA